MRAIPKSKPTRMTSWWPLKPAAETNAMVQSKHAIGPNNCDGGWDKGEAVKGDEVKAKNECWHQSDAEASHSN